MTTRTELPAASGYVSLVLHTEDTCLIENTSQNPVFITYATLATTPAATAAGHLLEPHQATIRLAPGGIWGKGTDPAVPSVVVVSK